jgi:hypothetical protein
MRYFTRRIHSVFATAAFVHGALDFFPGVAGAFLDAANQFIFLAFDELQVIVGELGEFLLQLALGNVPVSFGGESAHIIILCFLFVFCHAIRRGVDFALQVACRPVEEIIVLQSQAFDVRQKFRRKTKVQKSCKLQTNLFIGLQIALIHHGAAQVQ